MLINLYENFGAFNQNLDKVATEILNQIKKDSRLLTPSRILNLLRISTAKNFCMNNYSRLLSEHLFKHLEMKLDRYDNEQKSLLFNYIACIEPDLNPPYFKLPKILFTIITQLESAVDRLSDNAIMNILDGYEMLPKYFIHDIVIKIKDKYMLRICNDDPKITSDFLLNFLKNMTYWKKLKKITDKDIIAIYNMLAKRLPQDKVISKISNIEKIIKAYNANNISSVKLLQSIYDALYQQLVFSPIVYIALIKNDIDITPIIQKLLEENFLQENSYETKVDFCCLLTLINREQFLDIEQELKNIICENNNELYKIIQHINKFKISNDKVNQLIEQSVISLENHFKILDNKIFLKYLLISTTNREYLLKWSKFLQDNLEHFDINDVKHFYYSFFNLEEYYPEQLTLFYNFTISLPANKIPLKLILNQLANHNKLLSVELSKSDLILNKIIHHLTTLIEDHKHEIKLYIIYNLAKIFEKLEIRVNKIPLLVKKVFEITETAQKPTHLLIDYFIGSYLIDKNLLRIEDAWNLFDEMKEKENGIYVQKVVLYILRKSSKAELKDGVLINKANEIFRHLDKNLATTDAKAILQSLATILAFPLEFIQPNYDLYLNMLKDYLSFGTPQLYMAIIMNLYRENLKNNYSFYAPFINEIARNYNTYGNKMKAADLIKILIKTGDINITNPKFYTAILKDLNKFIKKLRIADKVEIINALSRIGINEHALYEKCLQKIHEKPFSYVIYLSSILSSLFKVGYQSQLISNNAISFLDKFNMIITPQCLIIYLQYIALLNIPIDIKNQIYEKFLMKLEPNLQLKSNKLFYSYIKYVHKNKKWLDILDNIWPNLANNNSKESLEIQYSSLPQNKNLICEYLNLMNIEYLVDQYINDFRIDIMIPKQKMIIKVLSIIDLNLDNKALTGQAILCQKIYESFNEYKTVLINGVQFHQYDNHMDRVKYLIDQGIHSNNTEGQYDFSKISNYPIEDYEFEIKATIDENQKESNSEEEVAPVLIANKS